MEFVRYEYVNVALVCVYALSQANSGPHSNHQDAVLKGLCVLGGLYLLFVFESALGIRHSYKVSFSAALHRHFYTFLLLIVSLNE